MKQLKLLNGETMTKITVRYKGDESRYVSVSLNIDVKIGERRMLSDDCQVNALLKQGSYKKTNEKFDQACKAACSSGILYAIQKGRIEYFQITIHKIGGCVKEGDGDGFAVAGMLAAYNELDMNWNIKSSDYMGWYPV